MSDPNCLNAILTMIQVANHSRPTKFKSEEQSNMELEDVEFIDVPEEISPVLYASLAPREYRKLHALHSSVQKDKETSIRIPKRKPQFSYDGSTQPELPFLQQKSKVNDDFDYGSLSDDDFPTTTQLAGMAGSARKSKSYNKSASSGESKSADSIFDDDDSLPIIEVSAPAPSEVPVTRDETLALRESFVEDVFDMNASDDEEEDLGGRSAPASSSRVSAVEIEAHGTEGGEPTRETTLEHDIEEVKHRRISQVEQTQEDTPATASFPSWVNEFDADLIDQFKDYVDFID